ncbi:MAG: FadD32-like long-chain-fatty-acid--AMP ligase [Corynebacterium sp.]|nr:FadD32-like long-chain-fatty-acid--AMP ligase [Corynebacterium sp.]
MDTKALIAQFFNEKGEFNLPPQLTVAGLNEMLYQKELATDPQLVERITVRHWEYDENPEGVAREFTRKQVYTRIKAVAGRLQQVATIGDRAAILAGNSPEYVFAFLGAMYAGLVPIPLYDPTEPGHAGHIAAVLEDAKPNIILTNKKSAAAVRALFADKPAAERPRVLVIDALPDSTADAWVNPLETEAAKAMAAASPTPVIPVELPAYLQYTSGATGTPKGAILTNRSLVSNVLQIFLIANLKPPVRMISWLPMHHNMGIILASFMTILGFDMEIMTPRDFIQNPWRFVKLLSKPTDGRNIYAAVPNFALELATAYGRPPQGETLDLSALDGLIIGGEPVSKASVEAFKAAFSEYNLQDAVIRPSYGMAEASLLLSTPISMERPTFRRLDRTALANGEMKLSEDPHTSFEFASVGVPVSPMGLVIVDQETKQELPDGEIGEIWFQGDNVAGGYLNRAEATAEAFHNTLGGRLAENSRAAGYPDENWVATGDLGVFIDGEIYITGRSKDLIIIAGRNHYPQDIETTTEQASKHIRPASACAFSIPGEGVEQLIILAERDLNASAEGDADAIAKIREAVATAHGVAPADIRILAPNEVRRSSAGKIARNVNQREYLASLNA